MPRAVCLLLAIGLQFTLAPLAHAQELLVVPDVANGVYQPGQTIHWNLKLKENGAVKADFVIKRGGMTEIDRGTLDVAGGQKTIEAKLDEPGWLFVNVKVSLSDGKTLKANGGALVAPEKIRPALPRPDDFDAFWKSKLDELATVPANPKLEPGESGKANVEYFKITMDNVRGAKIHGQLARPTQGERFPAMLIVQWAGVYPLQKGWVTSRAAQGWLTLNVIAHDLPIDKPKAFYDEQAKGSLKDYPGIGNDDRETSYFLRMYLSCYRAAQYLSERPDWDGRTFVVTGGSQGGLQTVVTAGLHPKITAGLASVPAGCDLNGPVAGRMAGWPQWYWKTNGKDEAAVRKAAEYYDVVNFASRVRCPMLIGVGLIDTTCPPAGVFAAYNQLQGPKEIATMPVGAHGQKHGSHRPYYDRFNAWLKALVQGKPAPVR